MFMALSYTPPDTLKMVQELCAAGTPRELAEKQIEIWTRMLVSFAQYSSDQFSLLASKDDLAITKLELQKEIQEVKLELQQVKLGLQKEIQQVKLELQKEIVMAQRSTILWIAGIIIAQTAIIFTLNQVF